MKKNKLNTDNNNKLKLTDYFNLCEDFEIKFIYLNNNNNKSTYWFDLEYAPLFIKIK